MSDGSIDLKTEAHAEVYATPLEALNPAQPDLFRQDAMWPIFDRLRAEAPVHYTPESDYGPYWSVTRYNDIMAVDTNHQVFSSAGGITLQSLEAKAEMAKRPSRPSFIFHGPAAA
jgi:cytochrome P450